MVITSLLSVKFHIKALSKTVSYSFDKDDDTHSLQTGKSTSEIKAGGAIV